jgi:hypothetical protein
LLSTNPAVALADKIKVKNLFDLNGVSLNESLVTVPFSRGVRIVDAGRIQVRGYALDPATGAQKKQVIGVLDVTRDETNAQRIIIHTNRLMRKTGGKVLVLAGALTDTRDRPVAEQTVSSPQGQNQARFTLASRGFAPADVNLFTTDLYSASANPIDASIPIATNTVTTHLTAFLQKKVDGGFISGDQMSQSLARYNDSRVMQIIPNANLRAAMVSLVGTVGEPALGAMLDGENLTGKPTTVIDFTSNDLNDIAETFLLDNGRLRTLFKSAYTGEPFQALSARIAREALQQDEAFGQQEAIVGSAIETVVYAQEMLVDASLVSAGPALVKSQNDNVYAMLESGKGLFPRVGLLAGPIRNSSAGIFVNAESQMGGAYTSFENYIRRLVSAKNVQNLDTLGNPTLQAMFTNLTGLTKSVSFSNSLISDIDATQQIISDQRAIQLAGILKLTLV